MKNLVLLGLMVVLGSMAMGQAITVTKGAEGKNLNLEMLREGIYICSQEGMHYWLTRCEDGPESFVRSDDWQLVKVDRDLNIAGRLELPRSNRSEVVVALRDYDRISIVLVDSSDDRHMAVMKAIVQIDSMQLLGHRMDTLMSYEYGKKDRCLVWGATSPNGEYVGVLALVQYTEKKQYIARAEVYTSAMEQVWGREYAVGTMHNMVVTDRGEMVTLGEERKGGEEHFLLNVLSARAGDTYEVTVGGDPVNDIEIVNVLNRRIICLGTFAPYKSDPAERMTGGMVSMVFDIDSATLTSYTLHQFENEDVNILENKKTKKVQKEREVQMVMPLSTVATPFGGVMAVGHRHMLRYKNANGTDEINFFAQGIHLMAVDDKGEVKWIKNVRRNDMVKEADDLMYMALFADGNTVCLAKSEHPKYPGDYNIAKEAPEYEMGDKGNLVLYRVSEEGEVKKAVLEQKTKHSLMKAAKAGDGKVLMLTANGNKTRMMEVDFE